MKDRIRQRSKEGSISLEAAVILPICILVILFFTQILSAFKLEMNLRAAMDATAREAGLAFATTGLWEEFPQTAVDIITEETKVNLPSALDEWIMELTASQIAAPFVMDRVATYYERDVSYPDLTKNILKNESMSMTVSRSESLIWMDLYYDLEFLGLSVERSIRQPIVLWHPLPNIVDNPANFPEDIWSMDNFSRGSFFQSYFDSNLPQNYPVFSRFESGHATRITSVDITAPSYQALQDLTNHVRKELEQVAAYEDPGTVWKRNPISFTGDDIRSRSLLLVFPTNERDEAVRAVEDLRSYAKSLGVNLKIRRVGFSERYSDP